jgi:hypothetical protein
MPRGYEAQLLFGLGQGDVKSFLAAPHALKQIL